ncbi:MAG TPA: hypothetical protein VEQ15_17335 [Myxococcales bacterium]|nr:hypothetical protein [Myxococcales bacterium]
MIQDQFDLLLAHVAPQVDDIVGAKQEYFARTGGEVHEDDRSFESRLQAFFNWYLFDRRLDGVTPAQLFLQDRGAEMKAADKEVLMGFTQTRLGLYEYRGRGGLLLGPKKGQVRVRDAVTRKVFDVTERRQMHGLEIGDLFEARLVPVRGTWHFSTSFTYHPREITPVIVREIKKRKKQGAVDVRALLWELERMSLQADRFKNVSIEAIYNFESPFLSSRKSAHG